MNIINEMTTLRKNNLSTLKKEFCSYYTAINDLFEILHKMCDLFDSNDDFLRIIGLSFTKGILLLKSIFSLIIDGHAQEAGTLLRPLVEIIELHTYLSLDEKRIQEVINDNLPSAGNRAKKINGKFQNLRNHLNNNSSHFNFTYDACNHLVNLSNLDYKPTQIIEKKVLKTNVTTFINFQFFLCHETITTITNKVKISEELLLKVDNVQRFIIDNITIEDKTNK